MTDVLSQGEIDQLLSAITAGEPDAAEARSVPARQNIKIYDFKRPDKFSKDHVRTVSMIHETFARLASNSLSARLRSLVRVHVASVDQLTYEEFGRSIPNPTTLAVIDMGPLKGSAILEIDPAVAFALLDRQFGGAGAETKLSRELTDIESSVMEGVIVRLLGDMREAWSSVVDLRPRLERIETNPQFTALVPPSEMVALVTLETRVGEVEGLMNFCLPYLTVEPVASKLSAQYLYSSVRRAGVPENLPAIREGLEAAGVTLVVEVGSSLVRLRDVLSLRPGDLVRLDRSRVDDPLPAKVENRCTFLCRPGMTGRRMSVQVVKVCGNSGKLPDAG